jgi:hypothetical protein
MVTIFSFFQTFSQVDFVCGTLPSQSNLNVNYSNNTSFSLNNNDPIVFNVYFNIIRDDNGNFSNTTFTVGENGIQNAVRYLNIVYNPYNIFFKYYGTQQINSTYYTSLNASFTNLVELNNEFANPYALNFFIVNNFTGFSGTVPTAFVYDGHTSMYFTRVTFSDQVGTEQPAIIHEMAHVLNLKHVFENYNQSNCERVTRDPLNPLFNANTQGDQVEDTPAQPQQPCCPDVNDCSLPFNSTQTNFYNEQFENIIGGNFMSYSINCNKHFSNGQIQRIRASIMSNWEYYQPAMNTIESLYQPFETIGFPGNTVISAEDLGNGYALVCRNLIIKQRFQKGFNYIFPDNDGIIDPLSVNTNQIPLVMNHHFNYGVIINQVDPLIEREVLLCTRGQFCQEEKFIKGTDFITPILGSYDFTLEQWDEMKVSNPNLYEYLENNKYHIIKKETERGVIIEVTLFKS